MPAHNEKLDDTLFDLADGIRKAFLGSIESVVIEAAGRELILNWNDHNEDCPIDEVTELQAWKEETKT